MEEMLREKAAWAQETADNMRPAIDKLCALGYVTQAKAIAKAVQRWEDAAQSFHFEAEVVKINLN